ncbi:MAG: hypothetical protein ACI8T1_003867 [Verrucomicrobiales bacterium]|jgi:hypothetical protein
MTTSPSKNAIDLTHLHNDSIADERAWLGHDTPQLQFAATPPVWNGMTFDLRGAIQLSGNEIHTSPLGFAFPSRIDQVPIQRKATRLPFLHAMTGDTATEGAITASFQFHYATGQSAELLLRHGRESIGWRSSTIPDPQRAVFIADSQGRPVQLTRTVWENPHPDTFIESIDLALGEDGRPFVLFSILSE